MIGHLLFKSDGLRSGPHICNAKPLPIETTPSPRTSYYLLQYARLECSPFKVTSAQGEKLESPNTDLTPLLPRHLTEVFRNDELLAISL